MGLRFRYFTFRIGSTYQQDWCTRHDQCIVFFKIYFLKALQRYAKIIKHLKVQMWSHLQTTFASMKQNYLPSQCVAYNNIAYNNNNLVVKSNISGI